MNVFSALDTPTRVGVMRAAIRHLQAGGSVLIFPSGHIDPDPALLPGAHEALAEWSRSVEILLRRVPQTRVLATIVSGVLARSCVCSPLTRVRRQPRDRQQVAEFIQVMEQALFGWQFPLAPRVSFGEPVTLDDLGASAPPANAMAALTARAQHLLADHMALCPASPHPPGWQPL